MSDAHYQHALALFGQGRHAEGAQWLGQAAGAGHVPSMSLLGGQFLTGRGGVPIDTPTGIRLIMAAAERGGGYACAVAATLFAFGFAGGPDWPSALDHLQRAAELGFPPAQAQLRLLAGDRAGTDWRSLRRAIDIASWREPAALETLSEDPPVRAAPGLLSAQMCDALIARARPLLAPAKIYNEFIGGEAIRDARRNSAAEFNITDLDLVLLAARERLCALAGLPVVQAEICQVLHYRPGERYSPHFDFFVPESGAHAVTLAERGQRVTTVLVYLNADLEGGETDFPRLGVRHRGGTGDALMFRNVDAAGQPDRRTLHAGLPPTRGEKWLLSLWIRDRAPAGFYDPRLRAAMEGR
jgi:hypothetical protein